MSSKHFDAFPLLCVCLRSRACVHKPNACTWTRDHGCDSRVHGCVQLHAGAERLHVAVDGRLFPCTWLRTIACRSRALAWAVDGRLFPCTWLCTIARWGQALARGRRWRIFQCTWITLSLFYNTPQVPGLDFRTRRVDKKRPFLSIVHGRTYVQTAGTRAYACT